MLTLHKLVCNITLHKLVCNTILLSLSKSFTLHLMLGYQGCMPYSMACTHVMNDHVCTKQLHENSFAFLPLEAAYCTGIASSKLADWLTPECDSAVVFESSTM